MKNKVVTVLVIIILVLVLLIGGALGFLWYRDNHIFVEGEAYPISARTLDLREEDISFDHYEQVRSQLPDCWILWNVPFQGGKFPNNSQTLTVSSLTQEDVELLLTYFPELKTLEASGCGDYANLELYQAQNPGCKVVYQVSLGGRAFAPDTEELVLENGDYDLEVMLENLIYLPKVRSIQLKMPELTMEQIDRLKAAYAQIQVSCTVEILGREYDSRVTDLDLRDLESAQVAEVAAKLPMLPHVTNVELTKEDGTSTLTKEEVMQLKDALPGASFHYTFDFYGETISTTDQEVHIRQKRIGDEGIDEVRAALSLMEGKPRFVLEYCQISYELLAQVREEYRDKAKLVWRVEFGGGSTFTDAEIIRCTYDLVDDNCANLTYCEDVRFVDFGHNEWLDGCDFVAGMKSLEYCILSGAPIKSLEAFANCKNLKFLEIAFCEYITDLSPLASCTQLQMLNISNTHALDLSPLDELPLTHFCARTNPSGVSRISQEEQARFVQQHPDCWTSFPGAQPYGVGWRYGEDEITPLPQYELIQKVFRLPHAPNNTGWYLDGEIEAMIAAMEPPVMAEEAPEQAQETQPGETEPEQIRETQPEETAAETTAV